MLFDGFDDLGRIVLAGAINYAALVLLLRISGKRTLSKMNAFDFVVTVAFGSLLASSMLDDAVSVADAACAFGLLCALQYAVARTSRRFETAERLAKAEPALLLRDGRLIEDAMRRERVTEEEVFAALRAHGIGRLSRVAAVVMETEGSLSVIPAGDDGPAGHPAPRRRGGRRRRSRRDGRVTPVSAARRGSWRGGARPAGS